jgi:hypothetical protein
LLFGESFGMQARKQVVALVNSSSAYQNDILTHRARGTGLFTHWHAPLAGAAGNSKLKASINLIGNEPGQLLAEWTKASWLDLG